ncbi:Kalirin [Trichinella pseudospiralis]
MDPRISESLNWPSWIAAEKLLDHNDGQLAELAQGRTKLNTRTDRLVKTPNLSGMLPFYSYSANCVAHLQTGSHLDLLLHLASDSQSHSMAAPVLLQIVPKNSLLDDGDSFSITLKIPTEPTIW